MDIREYLSHDNYATKTTGIILKEVDENHSVCTLKIEEKHLNGNGFVMGGVIFTLADFAFAAVANYTEQNAVSASANIEFLSAAKGDLTAETKAIKNGRTVLFYETTVSDNEHRLIAKITTVGIRVKK